MFCRGASLARIALLILLMFPEVKVTYIRLLNNITRMRSLHKDACLFFRHPYCIVKVIGKVIEMVGYSSAGRENLFQTWQLQWIVFGMYDLLLMWILMARN